MKNLTRILLLVLMFSTINIVNVSSTKAAACPACGVAVSGCTCGTDPLAIKAASPSSGFCCASSNGGKGQFFSSAASCTAGCAAATATPPTSTTTGSVEIVNPIGTDDFTELVTNFLGWLLGIAGALALLMLIWGGILYVTSAGDEQKAAKGKRIVTWTILGLIVILMSYSIIALIEDIFINE